MNARASTTTETIVIHLQENVRQLEDSVKLATSEKSTLQTDKQELKEKIASWKAKAAAAEVNNCSKSLAHDSNRPCL